MTQYRAIILTIAMSSFSIAPVVLAQTNDKPKEINSPTVNSNGWTMFRGNNSLSGVATSKLADNPRLLWKFDRKEAFASSAAIVNGSVYVGCDDEQLYKLSLADGKPIWEYRAKGPVQSSPTIVNDLAIVGDDAGFIHAVNIDTGKAVWTFETGDQVFSSANHRGDVAVIASYDGSVYGLNIKDGKQLWKHETEGKVHATCAIVDDRVIVAGCDSRLHVLRVSDGTPISQIELGSVTGSSPAILGNLAFLGTYGHQVLGVDWVAGTVAWTFEDKDRQFPYVSSAAVQKDAVIIGGRDRQIRTFSPDKGTQLWTFSTGARVDSSPVICGARVFVGSSDRVLYALDIATGKEVWRYEVGSPMTASPAIGGGRLVIGTLDGVLHCFGDR